MANIAKGILVEDGIDAAVLGENLVWSVGVTNFGGLSVQLAVPDEAADRARFLLRNSDLAEKCEIK